MIPGPAWYVIGALFVLLGLSFVYKGWNATVLGRIHYWSGFLPFTLISPWLIHIPPRDVKKSLVKQREGLLCHMFIGPLFFMTAMPFLILGADLLSNGNGTSFANLVLNAGDKSKPAAIIYKPPVFYSYPIAGRAGKKIEKIFQTQIYEDENKKLLPGSHGTQQNAQDRYAH